MATRKFKTNPTMLSLWFKYLSARDPNASILRGPLTGFSRNDTNSQ